VHSHIAVEGESCWRKVHASRVAFLVDGAAYFEAFAAAAERARRSIMILAWDIHSRVRLRRDGRHELPNELGHFLHALLARRPELEVRVLDWNFAMIYAFEREFLPRLHRVWRHPRLHFRLDADHPLGGSQHQKIVVVDDAVAFLGGLDIALCRWDTRAHGARDPRRVDAGSRPYPPFHDVQIAVDGDAAAALGELARERWRRATGHILPAPAPDGDVWPPTLAPDVRDVTLAIARTDPEWNGRAEVREVETLFLRAIAAAERSLYIENQYFTSIRIGDALVERLREKTGPEIVIVVPCVCSGWLEESTMGVLRARLFRRLHDADGSGRLRIYYPSVPELGHGRVNVHSKVLVVDETHLRIGSANLSNRSMGLDTECDLALDAGGDARIAAAIARFRNGLLAEHLGTSAEAVGAAIEAEGSLAAGIERLRGGQRTLAPVETQVAPWLDDLVPETAIVDPDRPVAPSDLVKETLFGKISGNSLVQAGAVLAGVAAFAVAWHWTSLGEIVGHTVGWAERVRWNLPLLAVALLLFTIASLLMVPVTALVVAATVVFGPLLGFVYALIGAFASAGAAYAVGRGLSRDALGWIALGRRHRLSPRLLRRSLRAVTQGRLLRVAPLVAVSLSAGASGIGFRTFAQRALLTLVPGVLVMSLLVDRFARAARDPSPGTIVGSFALLTLLVLVGLWLKRRLAATTGARRG
jgi:phosphatidylserine/phosphatidylglycerophosphate/cardiolipin synthase-like enzyme/uncharacterized membrane protein YdjX (TVP38/TMEM64 family)